MEGHATTIRKISFNNETFTIGSYNGFEILIRDKDGYINATKLLQQINEREHQHKPLKNIIRSPMYQDYKNYIIQGGQLNLSQPLDYLLPTSFINDLRGTYVYKELLNIICMKASMNYLHDVNNIMDKINETTIAEHEADKTQAIEDQFHNVMNTVTDTLSNRITELNADVKSLIPRAVPKGKQRSFCLIVEEIHQYDDQIKIQIRRKMKKTISKGLMEYYKNDTLLFIDNLPIATTINEVIKEQLSNREGMKIKATKYTFPYDQLDDIIERIREIVDETQDI
ncbi:MAG: hypothetical protein EZS28_018680 [Streblomastix strix]|uniref:KilA-N domain-containing protein n=1 Tax=Streblomastix strix TaxID=222440 RepID=A0A5J4VT37_9EUKA|nr:MAG: hypothetical protein EZS28_018680 [Streblomastix strix]